MASEFQGPILTKKRGGLSRRNPSDDAIFGFVCGGVTTAQYTTLGEIVELKQAADADAFGINAAYDANNGILVRHHIDRFFHYNPDGTLYLKIVAQGTTMAQMCDYANSHVLDLFTNETIFGKVKHAGVVLNPDTGTYSPVYANGLDPDVEAAIAKAQELIDHLRTEYKLYKSGVLIEGRMEPSATLASLGDLSAKASDLVSVVVASDPATQDSDAAYANYADVGSALGMLSVRKVSESLGSLIIANVPEAKQGPGETYPLTDEAQGYWLSAALSNGTKISTLAPSALDVLRAKRYIFVGKYAGQAGYFFNDSHSCVEFADDYAYIEDNRIWAKAATLVRAALLPVMKSEVQVDPESGNIAPSQIQYYQQRAKNALSGMLADQEIAGEPVIIIDPDQNVASTGRIDMALSYVRNGILRELNGSIAAVAANG